MNEYTKWRDDADRDDRAGRTYNDFLNENVENMRMGLDRFVFKKDKGFIIVEGNIVQALELKKISDDLYQIVSDRRYLDRSSDDKNQIWTQDIYPKNIEFSSAQVKAVNSKHSGFYLEVVG